MFASLQDSWVAGCGFSHIRAAGQNFLHCCRSQEMHWGESSVQSWRKQVQTLEGVLTLPYFSPYRIVIPRSEPNKQITEKCELCPGYLFLPLPSVSEQSGNCLAQHLHPADTQIFWWWWRENVDFPFFFLVTPSVWTLRATSGRLVVFNEDEPQGVTHWRKQRLCTDIFTTELSSLQGSKAVWALLLWIPSGVCVHWDIPSTELGRTGAARVFHTPWNPWVWAQLYLFRSLEQRFACRFFCTWQKSQDPRVDEAGEVHSVTSAPAGSPQSTALALEYPQGGDSTPLWICPGAPSKICKISSAGGIPRFCPCPFSGALQGSFSELKKYRTGIKAGNPLLLCCPDNPTSPFASVIN